MEQYTIVLAMKSTCIKNGTNRGSNLTRLDRPRESGMLNLSSACVSSALVFRGRIFVIHMKQEEEKSAPCMQR
jgi:hypothetical protein